jgi:hypothetical protein
VVEDRYGTDGPFPAPDAGGGASWRCPYCGRGNPPGAVACQGCGGTLEGSSSPPPVESRHIMRSPVGPFHSRTYSSSSVGNYSSGLPIHAPGCLGFGGGCLRAGSVGCAILLGLVVLAGGAGVYWFLQRTHDEILTVESRTWERTIEIERLERNTEEAWEGHVPAGARRISSWSETTSERVRTGTRRVHAGVRDLGDGRTEDIYEDRPVYENQPRTRTKVRYEIDRWRHDRTLRESGSDLSPRWPEVRLQPQERESSRRESYKVRLRSESGAERAYTAPGMDAWLGFEVGQKCQAKVNRLGTVMELLKTN